MMRTWKPPRICRRLVAIGLGAAALLADAGGPRSSAVAIPLVMPEQTSEVPSGWPLGLPLPKPGMMPSPALARLGAYLFRSKVLSADGTVACVTCHVPALGYSGDVPQAIGVGGYRDRRHAPALVNLYAADKFMWDGRARDLDHQVLIPLTSPEMAVDWAGALSELDGDSTAAALRDSAGFTSFTVDVVTGALVGFLKTIVSGGSRFDRFFYGHEQDALTESEQRGFRVFVRKGRCATCHLIGASSALFTDGALHNNGFVHGLDADPGLADVTGDEHDRGKFKTPSLRDVTLRPFLMHDGLMTSIKAIVSTYNLGPSDAARHPDQRLQPLFMNEAEIDDLVDFLRALQK